MLNLKMVLNVGIGTGLSRVLGFFRESFFASILGVSLVSDAFSVALKLPSFVRKVFADGAFQSAFTPEFARKDGEKGLQDWTNQIFSNMFFFLFIFIITFEIFAFAALRSLTLEPKLFYTLAYSQILLPTALFMFLHAFSSAILNARGFFLYPALAPGFLSVGAIAFFLLAKLIWGDQGGASCAVAYLFGSMIQALTVWYSCKKQIQIKLVKPKFDQDFFNFLTNFLKTFLGTGAAQLNILVDVFMVNAWLDHGAASYLHYADKIIQLPISLLGTSLGSVLLPTVSRAIYQGKKNLAKQIQGQALIYGISLSLGIGIFIHFLSEPIVFLVYERGAFSRANTIETARILSVYGLVLPTYVIWQIFKSIMFAQKKFDSVFLVSCFMVGINLVAAPFFISMFKVMGVPLATIIANWSGAFLALFLMYKDDFAIIKSIIWLAAGRFTFVIATVLTFIMLSYQMFKVFDIFNLYITLGWLTVSGLMFLFILFRIQFKENESFF